MVLGDFGGNGLFLWGFGSEMALEQRNLNSSDGLASILVSSYCRLGLSRVDLS